VGKLIEVKKAVLAAVVAVKVALCTVVPTPMLIIAE
jgi:hypothetical protein